MSYVIDVVDAKDGTRSYPTILSALYMEHVLKIIPEDDGRFTLREQCDKYFRVCLTPEQLLALSDEIRAIAQSVLTPQ